MSDKFSLQPWHAMTSPLREFIVDYKGVEIADLGNGVKAKHNALLIAQAPRMLYALRAMLRADDLVCLDYVKEIIEASTGKPWGE